jgi:5-methylcytosine-specific restriction endonuclease McrA
MSRVLTLDSQGTPNRWCTLEAAIVYHAKGLVLWELGDDDTTIFRGGENRITGQQSRIVTRPIICVKGEAAVSKRANKTPSLTNRDLFRRDNFMCAYCGGIFKEVTLTRDHVVPRSKGGADRWTNVVTACEKCSHRKDDHLLQECGMSLLYVPYAPNRAEALILENRNVLGCQMEYLRSFIPEHSRVWKHLDIAQ